MDTDAKKLKRRKASPILLKLKKRSGYALVAARLRSALRTVRSLIHAHVSEHADELSLARERRCSRI